MRFTCGPYIFFFSEYKISMVDLIFSPSVSMRFTCGPYIFSFSEYEVYMVDLIFSSSVSMRFTWWTLYCLLQ